VLLTLPEPLVSELVVSELAPLLLGPVLLLVVLLLLELAVVPLELVEPFFNWPGGVLLTLPEPPLPCDFGGGPLSFVP
jgi:hypothetical protein